MEKCTWNNWVTLHQHSDASLLDGFSKVDDIAKTCKEYGYRAAALTDHGSISNCVAFFKECKKTGIKPILGCEFYFCSNAKIRDATNRSLTHVVILAKNLAGWHEMIQCVSDSYLPEHFYFKPRIDYEIMKRNLGNDNHICILGHPGTALSDCLFTSNEVYRTKSPDEAKTFLVSNWKERALDIIEKHYEIFKDNLYIEIQLIDTKNLAMSVVVAECLRQIVAESNGKYKPVATADSHYVRRKDAIYQRILLCSALGRTLPSVIRDLRAGRDVPLGTFFISDNYHIPTFDEMQANHTEEELSNAVAISELCEEYDILSKPVLPSFPCPDGKTELDYLKELCEEGWRKILVGNGIVSTEEKIVEYRARLNEELGVIEIANLSGYFLIVQDIINFCRSKGWLPGPGRGSAAGCLISYLIGITSIDPIPYGLLFSRFYNAGRIGTLPDIDMDIPSEHREEIIQYIKTKYGGDYVGQMITLSSLMGRSALKEVLRVEDTVGFTEMNEITKDIPDEAQIADELEATGEKSIIMWALKNRPKSFSKWCTLEEDGTLTGDLADSFSKAIAIEGTYKAQGKHAAGVIISGKKLSSVCPIVRDKEGNPIIGLEMGALEDLGIVKFDVLGVDILTKIMKVQECNKDNPNFNINDFSDQKVWDMLSAGNVKGVFQIENQARWTKQLKPRNIHHLAALVSIIRPGVCEAMLDGKSMTKHYIDRKNGEEETTYLHPELEPLLNDAYGIIIYQEQAMKIASRLAGFTLDEADTLRKAIGKKLPEVMAKVKVQFLEGCKKVQKIPDDVSVKTFEWIEASQRYSFNASHAYSYAVNAFQSAYCKCYDPYNFYRVYLDHASNKQDSIKEIRQLINDAKLSNIEVKTPNLANFYKGFTCVQEEGKIFFGIELIKDIGKTECAKIFAIVKKITPEKLREMSWIEILDKFGKIKKQAMIALISTGCFYGKNNKISRNQMIYEYDIWRNMTDRECEFICANINKNEGLLYHVDLVISGMKIASNRLKTVLGYRETLKNFLYGLEDDPSWVSREETKYMGISLSCTKTDFVDYSLVNSTCKDIIQGNHMGEAIIIGTLGPVKEHKIKKAGKLLGRTMAFLSVDDGTAELNTVVIFPDDFDEYRNMLFEENPVMIIGSVSNREGENSLIVNKVIQV